VPAEAVARALERLVALDYAVGVEGSGGVAGPEAAYRAIAQGSEK
jgi:hypothetical protein